MMFIVFGIQTEIKKAQVNEFFIHHGTIITQMRTVSYQHIVDTTRSSTSQAYLGLSTKSNVWTKG